MISAQVLNSKERKKVFEQLEAQFGCDCAPLKAYGMLLHEKQGRILLVGPELLTEDFDALRVDSIGLYLGTRIPNGEIRLSIEGSQLIGPHATKNVLELDEKEFAKWIRGNPVDKETAIHGFVLLKHGNDFCGCGKPVKDEKTDIISIHNYIPKTRYVRSEE